METTIEPGEEFVLNFVMHRQSDLRALRSNFRKFDKAHQIEISTERFKSKLVG